MESRELYQPEYRLSTVAKHIAPGGVTTEFAGRSLARTFTEGENAYSDSLSKVVGAMNTRRGNYSTAESIAEVIFTAATEGTGQVIYLAGQDAEQVYSLRLSLSERKGLEMVRQRSGL